MFTLSTSVKLFFNTKFALKRKKPNLLLIILLSLLFSTTSIFAQSENYFDEKNDFENRNFNPPQWEKIFFSCLAIKKDSVIEQVIKPVTGVVKETGKLLESILGAKKKTSQGNLYWEGAKYLQDGVSNLIGNQLPGLTFATEEFCKPKKSYASKLKDSGADAIIFGEILTSDNSLPKVTLFIFGKNFKNSIAFNLQKPEAKNIQNIENQPLQEILNDYVFEISKILVYGLDHDRRWLANGIDAIQDNPKKLLLQGKFLLDQGVVLFDKNLDKESLEYFEASLLFFEQGKLWPQSYLGLEIELSVNYATALLNLGRTEEAVKAFRPIQDYYSDFTPKFFEKAADQFIIDNNFYEAAESLIEVLPYSNIDPFNYYLFGTILLFFDEQNKQSFEDLLKSKSQELRNSASFSVNEYFAMYIRKENCNFLAYEDVIVSFHGAYQFDNAKRWLEDLEIQCLEKPIKNNTEILAATSLALTVWENGYGEAAENLADFILRETQMSSTLNEKTGAGYAHFIKAFQTSLNWKTEKTEAAKKQKIENALIHYKKALELFPPLLIDKEDPDEFYLAILLSFLELDLIFNNYYSTNAQGPEKLHLLNELNLHEDAAYVLSYFQILLGILQGNIKAFPDAYINEIYNRAATGYWEYQNPSEWVELQRQSICAFTPISVACQKWNLAAAFTGEMAKLN